VRAYGGDPSPRIVFASSLKFTAYAIKASIRLTRAWTCVPANPYGASKAAAEAFLLSGARSFGLDVVVAARFNHIGPNQAERFVVASLAAQLARIAGGGEPQMYVGSLSSARDFLDVRDVVEAYLALARRAKARKSITSAAVAP